MRRSLGGANGGMLRTTVQRAAGGTSVATESFSHTPTSPCSKPTKTSSSSCKSTNSNTLLITTNAPSSPFSRNQTSVPVSWTFSSSSSSVSDEFDDQWECIDHGVFQESEDYGEDHFVFGSVPSVDEVQHAVSSLQQVLEPVSYSQLTKDRAAYDSDKDVANHIYSPTNLIRKISSVGLEVNWMETSLQPWNSRFLKPQGSDRVCNALHLLHTESATAIQCKREDFIQKIKDEQGEGCNIVGTLEVNKVAGNFHFAPGKSFHQANLHVLELLAFQMDNYNITHRINKLSFGDGVRSCNG